MYHHFCEEFKFRGWYDAAFRLGQETHQILFEFQQTRWASRSKSRSRSQDVSSLAFYHRRIPNRKVHELYAIKNCQVLVKNLNFVAGMRRNAASYQPRNLNSSQVLDNFLLHITIFLRNFTCYVQHQLQLTLICLLSKIRLSNIALFCVLSGSVPWSYECTFSSVDKNEVTRPRCGAKSCLKS